MRPRYTVPHHDITLHLIHGNTLTRWFEAPRNGRGKLAASVPLLIVSKSATAGCVLNKYRSEANLRYRRTVYMTQGPYLALSKAREV